MRLLLQTIFNKMTIKLVFQNIELQIVRKQSELHKIKVSKRILCAV